MKALLPKRVVVTAEKPFVRMRSNGRMETPYLPGLPRTLWLNSLRRRMATRRG